MHRTVCRVIRGACRKVRENECPALSGEEVRQQNNSKDEFVPPKHTWTEALGWTTGMVLTYEFIHRRRGLSAGGDGLHSVTASPGIYGTTNWCPFRLTSRAIAQPIVSTVNNVFAVTHREPSSPSGARKSIDVTPFIHEREPLFFKNDEELTALRLRAQEDDEDDGLIQFDESISNVQHTKQTGPKDSTVASTAEKLSGDIFSALGAFKFLSGGERKTTAAAGIELMEKGAELGSRRSLYNLGVSYDRLNEPKLAVEYYKRAADLGHPLASYNLGVLALQDGKVGEGLALLQVAAENGVEEAKGVIQSVR